MNDIANKALLPTGLRDVLPPEATLETLAVDRLNGLFAANGYDRVKPPLIEFEDSLLDGVGASLAKDTFRVMDPLSQRMMGVRADMTIQVARIATSRLGHWPRPVRLCYSGQVLRVKGTQLRPERQFTQSGIEMFGSASPLADAEVISLVLRGLESLSVPDVSIDLTLPTLVTTLCDEMGIVGEMRENLRTVLDMKDAAAVVALERESGVAHPPFSRLLNGSGEAETVLAQLTKMDLPPKAAALCATLAQVVSLLREVHPQAKLTADPVECRGFEYHTGIGFSVFARRARGELGRGGRYTIGPDHQPAVGATLFIDAVNEAMMPPEPTKRLLLSAADRALAPQFQADGWVTLVALDGDENLAAQAQRLTCSYFTQGGKVIAVVDKQG